MLLLGNIDLSKMKTCCAGYFATCKILRTLVHNLTTCSGVIFNVRTYSISITADRMAIKSRSSECSMNIIKMLTIKFDLLNLHKQVREI